MMNFFFFSIFNLEFVAIKLKCAEYLISMMRKGKKKQTNKNHLKKKENQKYFHLYFRKHIF